MVLDASQPKNPRVVVEVLQPRGRLTGIRAHLIRLSALLGSLLAGAVRYPTRANEGVLSRG